MATPRSYAYLAAKWITGYVPSQSDFDDLFSSFENVVDDNLLVGNDSAITAVYPASQSTAYAMTKKVNNVNIATTGTCGVKLPQAKAGMICFVTNNSAQTINVYPFLADGIQDGSANAPYPLNQLESGMFVCGSDGIWYATVTTLLRSKYKSYKAQLIQGGTSAPVAHVLENTYGASLVWTYAGVGKYTVTLTGAFPVLKCFATICGGDGGQGILFLVNLNDTNPDSITIMQFDQSQTPIDIAEIFIHIESYP